MQSEAEAILEMSETLESANFTRDQSDAFIQSVALAMKTFAVTPEVLDDRLGKLRREWKQDLKEHKEDSNRRFDGLDARLGEHKNDSNQRFNNLDKRLDDIQERQRTLLRYFLGFALAMFVGAMGILGALLFP